MKFFTLAAALMLTVSMAFANHHEEKKKTGHDKEHTHVTTDKMDHGHDEAHHKEHDHKAHHPEHVDEVKKTETKKK